MRSDTYLKVIKITISYYMMLIKRKFYKTNKFSKRKCVLREVYFTSSESAFSSFFEYHVIKVFSFVIQNDGTTEPIFDNSMNTSRIYHTIAYNHYVN